MSRLVTDHLPLLAGAPNGVKKLRELILELAVRGKLVAQDSGDEPASSLINKIQTTKINLAVNGVIKSSKALKFISNEETPFPAPSGWTWARAENISETIVDCPHSTPKFMASGMLCLDTSSFKQGEFVAHRLRYVDEITFNERNARLIPKPGDIVFAREGSVGESVVIPDGTSCCLGQRVMLFRPCLISSAYFRFAISGPGFLNRLLAVHKGIGAKHVNVADMRDALVPIPPLAEQHRIVAKIDELMALCDRLETRQSDAQAAHARLVDELLGSLLQARDAEDFQSCWQLLAENFQTVFTTEASVDALQSVVFGLAARGLLTRQNEADEQSSQLLERIAQHKQVRDKSTSRQQTLQEGNLATAGDVPFPLPNSWCWARWNDVALKIGDIDHKMPTPDPAGVPFVSPRDFYPGNVIDFEGAKRVARSDFERLSAKIRAECDDLIYPRYGTIGENVLVTVDRDFLVSYSCAVIKVAKGFVEPRYQFYVSLSDCIRKQAKAAENKTTQANVGIKSIQNFFFPLPPHTEQVRIVAKVNELLALCDRLKARIRQARQVQERLAGTLVERAVL